MFTGPFGVPSGWEQSCGSFHCDGISKENTSYLIKSSVNHLFCHPLLSNQTNSLFSVKEMTPWKSLFQIYVKHLRRDGLQDFQLVINFFSLACCGICENRWSLAATIYLDGDPCVTYLIPVVYQFCMCLTEQGEICVKFVLFDLFTVP